MLWVLHPMWAVMAHRTKAIAYAGLLSFGVWALFWIIVFALRFGAPVGPGWWHAVISQATEIARPALLSLRGTTGALATVLSVEAVLSTHLTEISRTRLYGWVGWVCSVPLLLLVAERFFPTFFWYFQISVFDLPGVGSPTLVFAAWSFGTVAAATGAATGIGGSLVAVLAPFTPLLIDGFLGVA